MVATNFVPTGSVSGISSTVRIWILPSTSKKFRKTLIYNVLWLLNNLNLLSLKTYGNVPTYSKKKAKKYFLLASPKPVKKRAGSGSASKRHGSGTLVATFHHSVRSLYRKVKLSLCLWFFCLRLTRRCCIPSRGWVGWCWRPPPPDTGPRGWSSPCTARTGTRPGTRS